MTLLLGIWTLSHLLLSSSSSSSPCGNQEPWTNADDELPKQSGELEAPWLVSILGNGHRCQGAVLNNWWILTAASCFLLMKPSYVELITTVGHFTTIPVSQFLSHRGFSSWATPPINDLGLVMLGQPIDLRRRGLWPVCIPNGKESPLTWSQCRINKRDQDGSRQWLEKIAVYILGMSECSTKWPGTAERWNMCLARKAYNEKEDCRVPVGSPVLCHEPAYDHWELRGIVSQSSTHCSHPILASQVVPHLEWLWAERILKDPIPPPLGDTETTGSGAFSLATEPSGMATPQLRGASQTEGGEDDDDARQPAASPTEPPTEITTAASLGTSATTTPPVTPTRRESQPLPQVIIEAPSTAQKSLTTGPPFAPRSTKAFLTTNKQAYIIPPKKHFPLPPKSTTAGRPSAPVRPTSSRRSTRSRSPPAVLTVVHSRHVVIIPATTRPP